MHKTSRVITQSLLSKYSAILQLIKLAPVERIAIIGHMRSGSSLLSHILYSNPEIVGIGETHNVYRNANFHNKLLASILIKNRVFYFSKQVRYVLDKILHHYILNDAVLKDEFWNAIANEPRKIQESELSKIHFSYISRGLYAVQIKRYFDIFPKGNFLILLFEKDIVQNLEQTILRIQTFLGLDPLVLNTNIKSNEAYEPKSVKLNRLMRNQILKRFVLSFLPKKYKRKLKKGVLDLNKKEGKATLFKLTAEEKRKLYDTYFNDDVNALEELLGMSFKDIWY